MLGFLSMIFGSRYDGEDAEDYEAGGLGTPVGASRAYSRRALHESMSGGGGEDLAKLMKAADFAARKHSTQRRKDPAATPYINHPIGVAFILTDLAKCTDVDVLQAACLHDTIEDTQTTVDELRREFGDAVTDMVMECTDDKSQPSAVRKQAQIEHAPHISRGAKLVKLADKLYNLRDLDRATPVGWSPERVATYFQWAKKVCTGLSGTSAPIEAALAEVFAKNGVKFP